MAYLFIYVYHIHHIYFSNSSSDHVVSLLKNCQGTPLLSILWNPRHSMIENQWWYVPNHSLFIIYASFMRGPYKKDFVRLVVSG